MSALLATAMLAACGEGATDSGGDGAAENDVAEHRAPIAATEIATRDLSRTLTSSAVVKAHTRTRLASRTAGIVGEVRVEAGDWVGAGDLLARIDMSEQRAELRHAQAELDQARRDYERGATLHERGHLTSTEYERVGLELELAQRQVDLWRTRVGFGEVSAPMDAVVAARHVEPGEGVQAQEALFDLVSMDLLVLRIGVSELDVLDIEVGQEVPVTVDALPGSPFDGHVRRIFPTADQDARLVTVEIALPENAWDLGIRPGFLARVRMAIDPRPDTIAVPSAAIGEGDEEHYVFAVRDGQLHRQPVERGVQRGDWTEIAAGLGVGDVVLATDPSDMSDGQAVRIVGWRE